MKVAAIKNALEKYKGILRSDNYDQIYKWEVLQNFKTHWNVEAPDLLSTYDRCLKNSMTGHLWGGEKDSPKSAMKKLISVNPDFCRMIFRDLYSEDKELLLRLDRFGFHCDQLMEEAEKQYGKMVSHHHHDFKILSVYLALAYPKTYCIYDYPAFKKFAEMIEVQSVPEEYEILRFFKIMRAVYGIISKDEELQSILKEKLSDSKYYQEASLILCHDFYYTVGSGDYIS
jgi:hypothetical protein